MTLANACSDKCVFTCVCRLFVTDGFEFELAASPVGAEGRAVGVGRDKPAQDPTLSISKVVVLECPKWWIRVSVLGRVLRVTIHPSPRDVIVCAGDTTCRCSGSVCCGVHVQCGV